MAFSVFNAGKTGPGVTGFALAGNEKHCAGSMGGVHCALVGNKKQGAGSMEVLAFARVAK